MVPLDTLKAKFSVFWRQIKTSLIICSALFKCVFDISVLLSAKESNILSQKTKVSWRHFCYDIVLRENIIKIKLAGWGKKSKTQK